MQVTCNGSLVAVVEVTPAAAGIVVPVPGGVKGEGDCDELITAHEYPVPGQVPGMPAPGTAVVSRGMCFPADR